MGETNAVEMGRAAAGETGSHTSTEASGILFGLTMAIILGGEGHAAMQDAGGDWRRSSRPDPSRQKWRAKR